MVLAEESIKKYSYYYSKFATVITEIIFFGLPPIILKELLCFKLMYS